MLFAFMLMDSNLKNKLKTNWRALMSNDGIRERLGYIFHYRFNVLTRRNISCCRVVAKRARGKFSLERSRKFEKHQESLERESQQRARGKN